MTEKVTAYRDSNGTIWATEAMSLRADAKDVLRKALGRSITSGSRCADIDIVFECMYDKVEIFTEVCEIIKEAKNVQ